MDGQSDRAPPRVSLRLQERDGSPGKELPLVVCTVGDFSGGAGGDRAGLTAVRLEGRTLAQAFARIRPALDLKLVDPADPGGTVRAHPRFGAMEDFDPARLCLMETVPALYAATVMRLGCLGVMRGGRAEPDDVLFRRVLEVYAEVRGLAGPPPAAAEKDDPPETTLPDPDERWSPAARVFALAAALGTLLARRSARLREGAGTAESAGGGDLLSFDLAGTVERLLVPALWRVLAADGAGTGSAAPEPLPWAGLRAKETGFFLEAALAAAPDGLSQVLRGTAESGRQAGMEHAGWLAAVLEARIEALLTALIRHPRFLALEAGWRSLAHLVRAGGDRDVLLHVVDMSKEQVLADVERTERRGGDGDGSAPTAPVTGQSRLFSMILDHGYLSYGSDPFSLLLLLFDLDGTERDAQAMRTLVRLASAANCPVLVSASPDMVAAAADHAIDPARRPVPALPGQWRALRRTPEARLLGVAGPRILARARHRRQPSRPAPVPFEEPMAAALGDLPWTGGAVALAERAIAAHRRYGWSVAIFGLADGNGLPEPLAIEHCGDDPTGLARKPITDRVLGEAAAAALQEAGFACLVHLPGRRRPAFLGAPSFYQADDAPGVRRAAGIETLAARLPYAFIRTRFAHYLKVMLRLKVGEAATAAELSAYANQWLSQYIAWQADAGTAIRAARPLRQATVTVTDVPARPGFYTFEVRLQPHFQVDHLDHDLVIDTDLGSLAGPEA